MKDERRGKVSKYSKQQWARSRRLGESLRILRFTRHISGKFVSMEMGVSASYLSDLELGRRCFTPDLEARYRKAIE